MTCPICSKKCTIREIYHEWNDTLDNTLCDNHKEILDVMVDIANILDRIALECSHEWHADQDNDCNFCVKCGATQEIYTE